MIPLIFKRKKTAEYLRQNSGEQDDRKKHGQQSSRARTLEDHYSGNTSFSGHSSFDTGEPGSNPGYARQGSSGNNSGCDGSGVGGSGGGYLATGGYNYSYDYGGGVGGGGRGVGGRGGGVRGGSPQPVRRSPSPLGSGEWALRECENHTTWLNDLRKRLGQPQITDLRTAVADGITLVQLTEALTKSEVRQTDHDRLLSKPQALVNLDRCLAHLAACGVDVIGIQANDLVEGDLKSSLLLLTQIRRRYDSVQSLRTQGDGEHTGGNGGGGRGGQGGGGTERVTVHPSRWSPDLEMPGRIDTSPRLSRAPHTTDKVSPRMRRGQAVDEDRMIPGMMTSEEHVMSSGHQNLKHTDSERPARQFSSNNTSSTKPSPAPRTHGPMTSERPPSQLGVAWAADSAAKPRQTPDSAGGSGGPAVSVEGRLRQLLIDTQKTAARPVQYNDGELLLPPPPSRDFGDGVTLGGVTANHSAGLTSSDGVRSHGQASHDQGYVPSRPSDRRSGSRTETMLRDSTNQQPDPYLRHSAPPSGGQFTNYGFVSDSQPSPPYSESQRSASSVQKADMRSAWTKLYGPTSDFRPSGHSVTSSPYTGRRENTAHEELLLQPLTHKPPHSFNPSQQRRLSQPTNNHIPPHRGDSAPSPFPLHPRESPMGQSSSTQGQTSDSSYRSSHSGQTAMAGFKSNGGREEEEEEDEDEGDVERELRTLGPASKYPDSSDSRPSSARMTPQTGKTFGLRNMFPTRPSMLSRTDMRNSPQTLLKDRGSPAIRDFRTSSRDVIPSPSRDFNNGNPTHSFPRGGGSVDPRTLSGARVNPAFSADTNDGREIVQSSSGVHLEGLDRVGAVDSIFDYTNSRRQLYSESSSNRSVTPPLPPLSPTSSQPDPSSPSSTNHSYNPPFGVRPHSSQGFPVPTAMLRQRSSSALGVPRTPDLLVTSSTPVGGVKRGGGVEERRGGGGSRHGDRTAGGGGSKSQAVPAERKNHGRSPSSKYDTDPREISSRYFARSRSLDDLRESGNESNHDLSFDVETTMLTVAPSDISEMTGEGSHNHHHHHHNHNPHADVPPKEARAIKGQLERLETMYHDVIKMVGTEKPHGKSGRRWSIASSDTSSLRKGRHGMRGGSLSSRGSKDLRSIQRRFQRLESHVVTLARSLAHLSSELRTQNALRRDVDVVKRDLREMKQQAATAKTEPPISLGGAPFDKFRGWIPSLTNPKRINKLTQFFGQEPPLLEIFLKKLGYERYAKNFSAEHIGMIELPYMTEDRLETIGIPLGPRLRILQESQLCFRQENFDIYIV